MTGCTIADFFELAASLPEATRSDKVRYWRIAVSDQTFGYLWEPPRTAGLKQTVAEKLALVAERPRVFRGPVHVRWLRLGRCPTGRG